MPKLIFLLGAKDAEMDFIEQVLKSKSLLFQHATVGGTERVHSDNAYMADHVTVLNPGDTLVCIECRPKLLLPGVKLKMIDHNNPGDPGFDKGPSKYWLASSVGQLYSFLKIRADQRAKIYAAMDHCFAAASIGGCKGVTAKDVIALKTKEIAGITKLPISAVRKRIEHFKAILEGIDEVPLGNTFVADLRTYFLGSGLSLDLMAAQVAVAVSNRAALLRHRHGITGREMITLTGQISVQLIEAFRKWTHAADLHSFYACPHRGYAGAYK